MLSFLTLFSKCGRYDFPHLTPIFVPIYADFTVAAKIMWRVEWLVLMNPYVKLRDLMDAHFNEAEIRTLCFEINIDFEHLDGENKVQKIESLILYTKRRRTLTQLIHNCRAKRGFADWPSLNELERADPSRIFMSPSDTLPQRTSGGRKKLTTYVVWIILLAAIGYFALQVFPWTPDPPRPTRESEAQDSQNGNDDTDQEDPGTRVVEPTETSTPTEIPMPDLVVTDFSIEPSPASKFQPVTIRFNIVNKGDAAAGPFGWQWFSAGTTVGFEEMENGINSGAGLQIERTYWYSGCANYTTSIVVDTANAITELDESNNVQTLELPVSCLAYITFDTFPDGTPISNNTQLIGNEFSDWNIHLSSHVAEDYGEGSVPFIVTPGYKGTTANFLTTGNSGEPPTRSAGPFPLVIDFDVAVSFVRIHFRGAEGQTYRLFLFDGDNNQIGPVDSVFVSSDDTLLVQASLPDPIIHRIVFGRSGAVTIVEAIEFQH